MLEPPVVERLLKKGGKGSTKSPTAGKKGKKGKKDTDISNADDYMDPDPNDNHYGKGKGKGKWDNGRGDGYVPPVQTPSDGDSTSNTESGTTEGTTNNGSGTTEGTTEGTTNNGGGTTEGTSNSGGETTGGGTTPEGTDTDGQNGSSPTEQECTVISQGNAPMEGTEWRFRVEADVTMTKNSSQMEQFQELNAKLQKFVAARVAGCGGDDERLRKLLPAIGNITNVIFSPIKEQFNRRCETDDNDDDTVCTATDTIVGVYVTEEATSNSSVEPSDVIRSIQTEYTNANGADKFDSGGGMGITDASVTGVIFLDNTSQDKPPQNPKVANVNQEIQTNDNRMRLRGILPLCAGFAILVLLLMVVLRRRRRSDESLKHFYLEDDEDWKSEDHTLEEQSVENDGHTVHYEHDAGGMDTVDVHRCNSSLCEVCNQRKQLEFLRVERSFASEMTDDAMREYLEGGDIVAL
mmetsp:Transcript_20909/g.29518  ORF Transcript_20909/g.29518 Transcript_20909/m.29518 type:complete len:464 (-) Transcript_20909:173-1564(-)